MIGNSGIERFRPGNRFWIACLHLRSLPEQFLDNLQRRRKSDVVGVCLERQSKDSDAFTFDYPERLAHFVEKFIDALLVNPLRPFQDIEIDAHGSSQMDECLQIFGKAKATETQTRAQELGPIRGSNPIACVTSST